MGITLQKPGALTRLTVDFVGPPGFGGPRLVAMMLGPDGQLPDARFFVSREQATSPDGAVRLTGQEPTAAGRGGERLDIDLTRVAATVDAIVLCISRDERQGHDSAGEAGNVRVVDQVAGSEIGRSVPLLSAGVGTRDVGRAVRAGSTWRFEQTDRGYAGGLDQLRRRHGGAAPGVHPAAVASGIEDRFIALVAADHPAGYCDVSERQSLIARGVALGLQGATVGTLLDLELERRGVANEAALLDRLDGTLRLFTDKDRKLDDKERRDALQLVCRPASGQTQGLRHDVADRYVTQFCRERGVKVKVGLLRWAVP